MCARRCKARQVVWRAESVFQVDRSDRLPCSYLYERRRARSALEFVNVTNYLREKTLVLLAISRFNVLSVSDARNKPAHRVIPLLINIVRDPRMRSLLYSTTRLQL